MAKAPKAETAEQAQSKPKVATAFRKLVPLEKRLSRQRKEEAKRRRQLDAVQSCSERAKGTAGRCHRLDERMGSEP